MAVAVVDEVEVVNVVCGIEGEESAPNEGKLNGKYKFVIDHKREITEALLFKS